MKVLLNGKTREFLRTMAVKDLLEQAQLRPELVAVELNGEIVKRIDYGRTVIRENDKVELVTMMGGG